MIFRQLFEPLSSTYTYLLGCEDTGRALLIDPAYPTWERDLRAVRSLGLRLAYTVETHVHADHITGARRLKEEVGSAIAYPARSGCTCADVGLDEGHDLRMGSVTLAPLHTPGHTDDHHAYLVGERVFTGDALLIDGCGRTDFQNGDAEALYRSVHTKLFALPDDTLVYPAHDYAGRASRASRKRSTVTRGWAGAATSRSSSRLCRPWRCRTRRSSTMPCRGIASVGRARRIFPRGCKTIAPR